MNLISLILCIGVIKIHFIYIKVIISTGKDGSESWREGKIIKSIIIGFYKKTKFLFN